MQVVIHLPLLLASRVVEGRVAVEVAPRGVAAAADEELDVVAAAPYGCDVDRGYTVVGAEEDIRNTLDR